MSTGGEQFMQWASEQSPWIKFTIGAVALIGTIIGIGLYVALLPNPLTTLTIAGAVVGAIHGGVEAYLTGGDFGDVMLGVGLGAAFGAIVPYSAFGAAAGAIAGVGIGALVSFAGGGDADDVKAAAIAGFQVGSLVGGITGGFKDARRYGQSALLHVGPDLLGAGGGAIIGYSVGGDMTSSLHGAYVGMLVANVAFHGSRLGLRAVTRGRPRGGVPGSSVANLSNKQHGRLREIRVHEKLKGRFGQGNVLSERTLLDASGTKVVDPLTSTGRRIDFVVLDDVGNARFSVEVTSRSQVRAGGKLRQLQKEGRIRSSGGVFVRDPATRRLIDVSDVNTRVVGVEPL